MISCRLVLNLRRLSHSPLEQSLNHISAIDLNFTANGFLGNIGAPLRSADEERVDFDDDIGAFGYRGDSESDVTFKDLDVEHGSRNEEDGDFDGSLGT